MEWKRQTKDSVIAEEIASYDDQVGLNKVRSLITSLDTHAVITWTNRPRVWEYWRRHAGAWEKVKSCPNAAEAKHLAQQAEDEQAVLEEVRSLPSGAALKVVAEWRAPYTGTAPIELPCQTSGTAEAMAGIFKRLGCNVTTRVA